MTCTGRSRCPGVQVVVGLRSEVDELAAECPAESLVLILRVDQDHIVLIPHEYLHHLQLGGKPFSAPGLSQDESVRVRQDLPVAAGYSCLSD